MTESVEESRKCGDTDAENDDEIDTVQREKKVSIPVHIFENNGDAHEEFVVGGLGLSTPFRFRNDRFTFPLEDSENRRYELQNVSIVSLMSPSCHELVTYHIEDSHKCSRNKRGEKSVESRIVSQEIGDCGSSFISDSDQCDDLRVCLPFGRRSVSDSREKRPIRNEIGTTCYARSV